MPELTVVLVDDHPIVRDGLTQVLAAEPGLNVVCTCADCAEAIAAVEYHRPDFLILDAKLPDQDGISAIPSILASSAGTNVILFTATVDEERAVEALRTGAKAVLLKSTSAAQLIDTIAEIAAGASWIAPGASGAPARNEVPLALATKLTSLTPREREVAELVARGARNKQIAWQLGMAEGTVKLHVTRAFRKLGVDNRVGLSRALDGRPHPSDRDHR